MKTWYCITIDLITFDPIIIFQQPYENINLLDTQEINDNFVLIFKYFMIIKLFTVKIICQVKTCVLKAMAVQ